MTRRETALDHDLALVFAPLDKRALGLALGILLAIFVGLLTLLSLTLDPAGRVPLVLLREFFRGYDVSLRGAFIGAAWAFFTGFVWGWFLAFTRNLVLAIWLIGVRVRADLSASRTFLDHI